MERKDLLEANAEIFTVQGKALDAVASRNVKVLVVGNPANTNAYIAMKSAPSAAGQELHRDAAPGSQPRAVATGRQDRQAGRRRSRSCRLGQPLADDVRRLPLRHRQRQGGQGHDQRRRWNSDTFMPTVGKRGAAIIEARGLSSAASAANAASITCATGCWAPTANGSRWVSRPTAPTAFRGTSSAFRSRPKTANTRSCRAWNRRLLAGAHRPDVERTHRRTRRRETPGGLSAASEPACTPPI